MEENVTCINAPALQTCFLGGEKICFCKRKKNKRNSFKPEPDRLMWIITMVRQWKTFFFFFLMFQANHDGNKQMVPIRKLFSKFMQGSTHYNNKIIIKYNKII